MGPCPTYLTPPGAGTSPAAEFKELRSCPPREKERVQPLELVCSGVFFLNLLDHLVTLLLRAARFEANLGHNCTFSEPFVYLEGYSVGRLPDVVLVCEFVNVLGTSVVIRFQVSFSVDFSAIFDKFRDPFCVLFALPRIFGHFLVYRGILCKRGHRDGPVYRGILCKPL